MYKGNSVSDFIKSLDNIPVTFGNIEFNKFDEIY